MQIRSVLLAILCLLIVAPLAPAEDELHRFEAAHRAMGSVFQITAYSGNQETAGKAIRAAFDRIDELDDRLSDYHQASELSQLSSSAPSPKPVPLSDDLFEVLRASQQLSEQSGGTFDVTIGPLTSLWRSSRRNRKLPAIDVLKNAKAAVGHQHIRLDLNARTAQLLQPNMRLDLGGIAKGFAADKALSVLKAHGVDASLVNCSGDMAIGEAPPGRNGWTIGVAPLERGGKPSVLLSLKNCGVATSGDAFQFVVIDGKRYSHIVDPQTGLGMTTRSSVTVIAKNGTQADGLASTVSVMGSDRGLKLVEDTPHAAASYLSIEGEKPVQRQTTRFADFVHRPKEQSDDTQPEEHKKYGSATLEAWRARLADFDVKSSSAAATVEPLIQIVQDKEVDALTRRQAALVLGRIGKPARSAVPVLIQVARVEVDGPSPNAVWAIKALALMQGDAREATNTLVAIVHNSDQPVAIRQMAVEALGQIGGAHSAAVPALIDLLEGFDGSENSDESAELRLLAIEALGLAGADAAVAAPLLIRLLRSPDESPWLRRQSALSLGGLGNRAAVAIEALVETLEFDSSESVRDAAGESLASFGEPALPHLQRQLAHPDESVRWRAAKAIGQIDPPIESALPSLLIRLRDRSPLVRITVAESAWAIEPNASRILTATVNLLADEDRTIRVRALNLLISFGPQARSAQAHLQAMQRSPRPEVRRIASKALAHLETER